MRQETINTITAFLSAAIADKAERAEAIEKLSNQESVRNRDKMLTTKAAAALAGVCDKTLFRWEGLGYLHPKHITARRVRWSKRELETFLCETAEA